MQFRVLEPCRTFNAVQDHRTLLYSLMQVRALELRHRFNFAMSQFRTVELCYTIRCRSGSSNSAIRSDAVQDSRTSLHVPMQFRTLGLCQRFNFAILQFRTREPCYTFQCSTSLRNFAISFNAVQDTLTLISVQCRSRHRNHAIRLVAVQDRRTLLYESM